MIERQLFSELDRVAARLRQLYFGRSLALALFLAALGGAALWFAGQFAPLRPTNIVLVSAAALAGLVVCWWFVRRTARDHHALAQRIEAAHPELRSCLLAAIEQRRELPFGRLGYLQEDVVRQALAHAHQNAWPLIVPNRSLVAALLANVAALALLVVVMFGLAMQPPPASPTSIAAAAAAQATAAQQLTMTVEPGNTEIERGTGLLVLARFTGPEPVEATLVYRAADGQETRLPMSKSLDDPVFGTRISSVEQPLDYRVELPGKASDTYHVGVFEYPQLVRADAQLTYPGYTQLDEKLVQDVRTVSVVEGTVLTLLCHLNKPVQSATLIERDAPPLSLTAAGGETPIYQVQFQCEKSRRLKLQLVDEAGRQNVKPAEFVINVVPNKPPDLKLAFPSRDVEVSPLEETDVKASVYDDFGLRRVGLTYALAGAEPADVVLAENTAGKERRDLAHVIRFEALQAEPDQLLSYYVWAEDIGPDGQVRRTNSDMFFAEVRPFEEIFRQGEQPPGGEQQQQQQQQGSQNAQAAQKLAELQKEIINATWKLIRRETGGQLSTTFAADALLVYQSQASALEQAQALAEELQDPQSKAHAGVVTRNMTAAWHELEAAKDGPATAPLQPALVAEQAAYQALLKLRAREHRVVRSQNSRSSSSSSSSASNRSQQQLQQLELKNEENRYETQRTAQTPEQQRQELQDRETRQVLSRLSELARRQNDLNERLKELQSALEAAHTEAEREEVRQQLKRLRDEQQQVLRDTDELANRMETPENQERMAEARQQLEQTRDQVRRASKALEENQVSQAAAAGTRAERDFQELRNEFRREASNRFSEDVRQMRDEARQLDEKENELAQRLEQNEQPADAKPQPGKSKSLRDGRDREQIAAELAEQQQRLKALLERMKQTIQEAEPSEPLLSQQLYDAARKAQDQNPERALEASEQSLQRGLLEDARDQERVARQGIGELRQGVERASESVLGDETEALRRAREELRRLGEELNDEIARNSPRGTPQDPPQDPNAAPGETDQPGQPRGDKAGKSPDQADSPANPSQKGTPGSKSGKGEKGNGKASDGKGGSGQPQLGEEQPAGRQNPSEDASEPSPNQSGPAGTPGQSAQSGQPGARGGNEPAGPRRLAGSSRSDTTTGGGIEYAPLTGEDFRNWSDRLRDVEEMVDDPQLRAEAARIRDRARSIRAEFKRHSAIPNWDVVLEQVSAPLAELRDRVAEELLRRTAKEVIVPLDRDPVPPQYSEKTRRYYERLGSGP